MKAVKTNVKFEKENKQNSLNTISIVYFLQDRLFKEVFSRTTTIHPGIFRGRALWADSVSPRTNTIASRDQFKPTRIGQNLVANYNTP